MSNAVSSYILKIPGCKVVPHIWKQYCPGSGHSIENTSTQNAIYNVQISYKKIPICILCLLNELYLPINTQFSATKRILVDPTGISIYLD